MLNKLIPKDFQKQKVGRDKSGTYKHTAILIFVSLVESLFPIQKSLMLIYYDE